MNNNHNTPWPVWKLTLLLYPFVSAAVAINLFMASLLMIRFSFEALSPTQSIVGGLILGGPVALWSGQRLHQLMHEE